MTPKQIVEDIRSSIKSKYHFTFRNKEIKKFEFQLKQRCSYLPNPNYREIEYHILNNLHEQQICKICNTKKLKFMSNTNSYRQYCSQSCLHKDYEQKCKNAKKAVETLRNEFDENGESLLIKKNKKSGETTKLKIDHDTGLSISESRSLRAKETATNNIKLGLNSYERAGKISSKLQRSKDFKLKHGLILDEDKDSYSLYKDRVGHFTTVSFKNNYYEINPDNLNRSKYEYHLDHIVSQKVCFENNIPTFIAGSIFNLQMLWFEDNLKKGSSSDMEVEELLEKFYNSIDSIS